MATKLKWTKLQVDIANLLAEKKTKEEIKELLDCGISTIENVVTALNKGQKPPTLEEAVGELTSATKTKSIKTAEIATTEITEASILKLIPKVQSLPLTPDIFIGFMCAIARGFSGDISDWLSLASRDFWYGRGLNPYEIVSGISSEQIKEVAKSADTKAN